MLDENLSSSFAAARIVKRKRSALSKSQAKIQKKTTNVEAGKPLDISLSESMVGTSTSSMSNAQFPAPGSLTDHDVAMGAPVCEVTPQVGLRACAFACFSVLKETLLAFSDLHFSFTKTFNRLNGQTKSSPLPLVKAVCVPSHKVRRSSV